MKKLAIIIIFLSLLSIRSSASTFHAIIFANTDDSHIGKSVYIDLKRMEVEMTAISKSIGYSIKKYFYYGDAARFNRDNLESVIDNLNAGQTTSFSFITPVTEDAPRTKTPNSRKCA